MVECELMRHLHLLAKYQSFNRYMVECELIYHKSIFSVDKSFNRYMVECELKSSLYLAFSTSVLIDTWWNVNVGLILLITWCIIVLIDTWWNVN